MRIIETKIYTIEEHPNKDKCYDWIRNNWHDLNQHSVDEVVDSIKALSKEIGGTYDYCIGQVLSRGEFISFSDYSKELLNSLDEDECPLTGVCWDIDLIKGLKNGELSSVLESIHLDTEYAYSDEGLLELCEANNYEFNEIGEFI